MGIGSDSLIDINDDFDLLTSILIAKYLDSTNVVRSIFYPYIDLDKYI